MEIKNIKEDIISNIEILEILKCSHYNPTKEKLLNLVKNYNENENIYPFVGYIENKIAGIIVIEKINERIYEIIDIAVHENYRNLGVASSLIDYITENFEIQTLYAETDDEAIGFYRKYGFNSELISKIEATNRYRCTLTVNKLKNKEISLDKLHIRKMKDINSDYELILKWYKNPRVTEYFRPIIKTKEEAIKKYLPRINGENSVTPCIIELNTRAVGYVQYYPINKEDKLKFKLPENKNIYGIDIFIGEQDMQGKGLGTKSLKLLTKFIFEEKNVDIIIIDPETRNNIAIRCYKNVGFVPHLKITVDGDEKLILTLKDNLLGRKV